MAVVWEIERIAGEHSDTKGVSSTSIHMNGFVYGNLSPTLKGRMDSHQGSYLLNLSTFDSGMEEIFGPPDKVIEDPNPLTEYGRGKMGMRVLVEILLDFFKYSWH